MKFEKQAEVMARCWVHMIKTGVISRFIKKADPALQLRFNGKHYLQLLDDIYKKYFSEYAVEFSLNIPELS